jgi:hypothetical protein
LPVLIYEPGDHSLDGAIYGFAVDMPNRDSQPIQTFDPRTSPNYQYFSTGAFSTPDLGSLGTSNRRFFHGPGINNWDMALHKTTNLTERTSIEFRAEFFNIFNHAQFNNPVGQFGAGNFGDVTSARDPRIGQMALKFNF